MTESERERENKKQSEQHIHELFKARVRIGESQEDRVRWLLRFYAEDIENMSAGDMLNRRYEFLAFAIGRAQELRWPDEPEPFPSAEEVIAFHLNVKSFVIVVLTRGWQGFSFKNLKIHFHSQQQDYSGPSVPWMLHATSPDTIEVLKFTMLYEVWPLAHKIRECPECKKIFLADRTTQEYCSVQCQNRVATRRYRQTLAASTGTITVSGIEAKLQKHKRRRPPKPKGGKR
jgi:hypothetical protein